MDEEFEIIEVPTEQSQQQEPQILSFNLFGNVLDIDLNPPEQTTTNPRKIEYSEEEQLELQERFKQVAVQLQDIQREASYFENRYKDRVVNIKNNILLNDL